MRHLIIALLICFPQKYLFSNNSLNKVSNLGIHKDYFVKKHSFYKTKDDEGNFQVVTGYVIDGKENKPISFAKIIVAAGFRETGNVFYTDSNGFFEIKIPVNRLLYIEARHDQYNVRYKRVFYNKNRANPDYFKIYLNPLFNPTSNELKPAFIEGKNIPHKRAHNMNMLDVASIYFYRDELVYDKESKRVLNEILTLLKANLQLKLEISSHTDGRASKKYEQDLSQKRAEKLKQFFVNNEIDPNGLVAKGYAATKPINNCTGNRKCTEKEFLANRRIEFIILNDLID